MIEYKLIRSDKRKKTISLIINRKGEIIVRAPVKTSMDEIEDLLKAKKRWIEKRLSIKQTFTNNKKEFVTGENFLYLGKEYTLEFVDNHNKKGITLKNGRFLISKEDKENAKRLFIEWYKKAARELILDRLNFYKRQLGFIPSGMKITGALSRYGSCSGKNNLSFSWRLIMAPLNIIDYVIIHEICHIKEKNHGPHFWGLVESIIPDYKQRRKWLKDHRHTLSLE